MAPKPVGLASLARTSPVPITLINIKYWTKSRTNNSLNGTTLNSKWRQASHKSHWLRLHKDLAEAIVMKGQGTSTIMKSFKIFIKFKIALDYNYQ